MVDRQLKPYLGGRTMKSFMLMSILLIAASAVFIAADAKNDAADGTLKKLDGTWTVKSVERDPPEKNKGEGAGIRCLIDRGRVTAYVPGEDKPAGRLTIKVDSTTSPMTMTITPDGEQQSLPAIFKLEDDKLIVCWKSVEEKRPPSEFSTEAGTGQTMVTLVREKKSKDSSP
jgi:uncharacterized protein (TIGR03067 family)